MLLLERSGAVESVTQEQVNGDRGEWAENR
jgi:hypothetical protein